LGKRIAHYSLSTIKELIAKEKYVVTLSARQSYTALGLEDDEVLTVIDDLKAGMMCIIVAIKVLSCISNFK
jgi:hypothetical protein